MIYIILLYWFDLIVFFVFVCKLFMFEWLIWIILVLDKWYLLIIDVWLSLFDKIVLFLFIIVEIVVIL